ncbi:MAG: sodium:proline symporter, partial [Candidatus Methanomethylophilaceae archaeon]|nr:sodium:proline symporter [Candidatus Methanomethylophilaceae archaeon]
GFDNFLNIFYDGGEAMSFIAIVSLLAWGLGYFGMPHIVVRFMSIRNPEEVKIARRVSLIWIVIALAAAIMSGVIGRAYYMETSGSMDGFDPEHIFILMAGDMFVPIIAGFLYAAVMAAIMSTADSQLLVASSSITNDVLGKSKRFNFSESQLMWISRGVVAVIAILALILALYGGDNIMGLVSYAWSGFGSAFGPLLILSLYWKRMNLQGAIASMITGFAMVLFWENFMDFTGIYSLLPGFLASLIVGIVVALVTPAPSKEIEDEFDAAQVYEEPMGQ